MSHSNIIEDVPWGCGNIVKSDKKNNDFGAQDWIDYEDLWLSMKDRLSFSKDYKRIRRHNFHLVTLYDPKFTEPDWQKILSGQDNLYLGQSIISYRESSSNTVYSEGFALMTKMRDKDIPIDLSLVTRGNSGYQRTESLLGETWAVSPEVLFLLDYVYKNGVFFKRRFGIDDVILIDQANDRKTKTWMYYGPDDFRKLCEIPDGSRVAQSSSSTLTVPEIKTATVKRFL